MGYAELVLNTSRKSSYILQNEHYHSLRISLSSALLNKNEDNNILSETSVKWTPFSQGAYVAEKSSVGFL